MDIKEFLAPSDVFIGIRGSNKTSVIGGPLPSRGLSS